MGQRYENYVLKHTFFQSGRFVCVCDFSQPRKNYQLGGAGMADTERNAKLWLSGVYSFDSLCYVCKQ